MAQATVHLYIGTALLIAYLATTVIYATGIGSGTVPAFGKYVSYLAALLLVLQYLVGIGLLASKYQNKWYHYVLAVLVIVPIGLEHGMIRKRFTGRQLATNLTLVAGITTFVIFLTWLVGRGTS